MPPPKFTHTRIAPRFYDLLRSGPLGARTFQEAGYRIGDGWLQSDVSVISPDQKLVDDYLSGAPMIAAEILSSRNTAPQIERKLTLYLSEGSRQVWVIDPKRRTTTVYRLSDGQVFRNPIDKIYRSEAAGVTIDLAQLFD